MTPLDITIGKIFYTSHAILHLTCIFSLISTCSLSISSVPLPRAKETSFLCLLCFLLPNSSKSRPCLCINRPCVWALQDEQWWSISVCCTLSLQVSRFSTFRFSNQSNSAFVETANQKLLHMLLNDTNYVSLILNLEQIWKLCFFSDKDVRPSNVTGGPLVVTIIPNQFLLLTMVRVYRTL